MLAWAPGGRAAPGPLARLSCRDGRTGPGTRGQSPLNRTQPENRSVSKAHQLDFEGEEWRKVGEGLNAA